MKIILSFVIVGFICSIASILYDMTKMSPGHITSLFVVLGALLSIFGLYDLMINNFGYGLSLPITSFGNGLVKGAYEGFQTDGIFGLFSGLLTKTSAGIAGTIMMSFIVMLFSHSKD